MASALTFGSVSVPGIVLPWQLGGRDLHEQITKFCGVRGESRINCMPGGRTLEIPVLVYASQFNTREKLSQWLDVFDRSSGELPALSLLVNSEAGRPRFADTSYSGMQIVEEPKIDEAGSLGGGAFAVVMFIFRQHA
jgi:hypothetical protein